MSRQLAPRTQATLWWIVTAAYIGAAVSAAVDGEALFAGLFAAFAHGTLGLSIHTAKPGEKHE